MFQTTNQLLITSGSFRLIVIQILNKSTITYHTSMSYMIKTGYGDQEVLLVGCNLPGIKVKMGSASLRPMASPPMQQWRLRGKGQRHCHRSSDKRCGHEAPTKRLLPRMPLGVQRWKRWLVVSQYFPMLRRGSARFPSPTRRFFLSRG